MNIINEVVDENGRPPYTQKKYSYKTRHSIITDVYNEVIRLRTEIANLSKQIRYTQNPQEREELIAKRQELYKLRNRAVAKVWNLSNERTMTQGAKDRAAIKRRENKPKATNINTTIESKTMNKKVIRLTEGDLHRVVKESVKRILKEHIANHDYIELSGNYIQKDPDYGELFPTDLFLVGNDIRVNWNCTNGVQGSIESNLLDEDPICVWNILKTIKN